jgi:hypothetical protein
MNRLAYFGMSWGASADGLIAAAVEMRYRAVVLVVGAIELFDSDKQPDQFRVAHQVSKARCLRMAKLGPCFVQDEKTR